MSVQLGTSSEIWLAPTDDHAGNKHSFLIRDDAYVMSEASFGRQVRLGQPIDLGPNGSWNQKGWFGGQDQERWLDEFMYEEGALDVTDRVGRLRLWPGFERLNVDNGRDGAQVTTMAPGASGAGESTPLIVGERGSSIGSAPSVYKCYALQPGETPDLIVDAGSALQAASIIGAGDEGSTINWMLLGFYNGNLLKYNTGTGALITDSNLVGSGPIGLGCIVPYNGGTYYLKGKHLIRREWSSASGITHTIVKSFGMVDTFRGMCVWQNRLWFLGLGSGGQTTLYTSDGVTAVAAINFPPGFNGYCMTPHYGSLYIGGGVNVEAGGTKSSGQLWRYNGSSLTKLWDGEQAEAEGEVVFQVTSHDRFVAWPRHGNDTLGRRAGVWYYDAEEDAILEGPTLDMDPSADQYRVTGVSSWNGTLAVAMLDPRSGSHKTFVGYVRKDGGISLADNANDLTDLSGNSFEYEPSTISRELLSSNFDADLPGTEKLLLTGFLRAKIPQGTQIDVAVVPDGEADVDVTTITYDAGEGDGWRTVKFDIADSGTGEQVSATEMAYRITLSNTDKGTYPTATPEVDFVGIQFQPAEERRRIWYVRVAATDGQDRLDGTANPLTTRQAIADKLVEFWRLNKPLSFWQAESDGIEPGNGEEVKVTISNLTEQAWRLSTGATERMSEVSFSLLEVTPTS